MGDSPRLGTLGVRTNEEIVYRMLLVNSDIGVDELCEKSRLTEPEVRCALRGLIEIPLVRESTGELGGRLHAIDPQLALQTLLFRQEADLARRQQEFVESRASVAQIIVETSQAAHCDIERVLGADAVRDRLTLLTQDAAKEVLSVLPGGAQSAPSLAATRRNDTGMLERGVYVRTIGLDSVRNDPTVCGYAHWLTDSGGQFRTAPMLPPPMTLVDGQTVVVPIDPDSPHKGALVLTSPGIIALLTALFEQIWAESTLLGPDRARNQQGLTAQETALIGLLSRGLTDEAAAFRLGVSARTARRMMADLMKRLGARSRFEAGMRVAQHGWV